MSPFLEEILTSSKVSGFSLSTFNKTVGPAPDLDALSQVVFINTTLPLSEDKKTFVTSRGPVAGVEIRADISPLFTANMSLNAMKLLIEEDAVKQIRFGQAVRPVQAPTPPGCG
jgi:hypothetical protein